MNISKYRNSYLIDKTYRLTLVSVTLTALAPLIATLVDGLFSSNLLGNDAFISMSVALPLVNAVSVLTMICECGGSVLAAGQLAKGNRDKANRIYTVAFASAVLVAVIAAVGIWINLDSISLGLTGRPESAVLNTSKKTKKRVCFDSLFICLGGAWRIRTAVHGFADR